MKTTSLGKIAALVAVTVISSLALAGCSESTQKDTSEQSTNQPAQKTVQYTCSMHPEVVQDKPGDCPKCGMKLVEKR